MNTVTTTAELRNGRTIHRTFVRDVPLFTIVCPTAGKCFVRVHIAKPQLCGMQFPDHESAYNHCIASL